MLLSFRNAAVVFACAIGLSFAASSAHANLVTNGSFEAYTGSTPKDYFSVVKPTGWTGGNALTFIDAPGTAANGTYLSVYAGLTATSPDGGNFVEADGAPSYSSAFSQIINALVVGKSYTLTFYQAAGQQVGFTGPTTEDWSVTFGDPTIAGDKLTSTKYTLAQGATGQWQQQTMTFVAHATTQTLSFLAVGTPNGAPPISFLDGVDLEVSVTEPATLTLVSVGLLGMGMIARRRASR